MPKKLSKNEVANLARLARLDLTDSEIEHYSKDLNSILEYIEMLEGVDVKGLKATSQVTGLENSTRPDEIREQIATPEQLLSLLPEKKGRYIKVRRMIK